MRFDLPPGPFEGVYVSRGGRALETLRQACKSGVLRRVRAGAYVDTAVWEASGRRRRSLLIIQAVAASRGFQDVLSHESAAVLLGLPLLNEPELVHFTNPGARSTRSRSGTVWHAAPLTATDIIEMPPFTLTSPTRTLADIALGSSFPDAVAVCDAALRLERTTIDAIACALGDSGRTHGRQQAQRVLAFADPRAANPGESLSRVVIDSLGFEAPQLQVPFDDRLGRIGVVDFWWERAGVIGELDGFQKYAKAEYLRGRTPSQVVVEEKHRERRLEALPVVRTVVRWVWRDALEPPRLHALLSTAGVTRR